MIETFKKYICSNCKGKCEKGIIVEENNGIKTIKCVDYKKEKDFEGYKSPLTRTSKQKRALMKLRQEY